MTRLSVQHKYDNGQCMTQNSPRSISMYWRVDLKQQRHNCCHVITGEMLWVSKIDVWLGEKEWSYYHKVKLLYWDPFQHVKNEVIVYLIIYLVPWYGSGCRKNSAEMWGETKFQKGTCSIPFAPVGVAGLTLGKTSCRLRRALFRNDVPHCGRFSFQVDEVYPHTWHFPNHYWEMENVFQYT